MIVLIGGAACGIGMEIMRRFVRDGHRVIAAGCAAGDLEGLPSAQRMCIMPVTLEDPTCGNSIKDALAALPVDWKDIDILVNNATLQRDNRLAQQASLDAWESMIATNCTALVAMTREVLPGMLARRRGTIVNVTSANERQAKRGSSVYGATVAFVHQYTLALMESLAGTGVRATCIAPDRKSGVELLNMHDRGSRLSAVNPDDDTFVPLIADIAESVCWIATLPAHININHMELAQTGELFSPRTIVPN
jgi:NADP-dependent 3-hydroxy acid dehydrogenase YdfG